jgi:hypothetical protein
MARITYTSSVQRYRGLHAATCFETKKQNTIYAYYSRGFKHEHSGADKIVDNPLPLSVPAHVRRPGAIQTRFVHTG